ncbi:hypothetical protein SAMN03097699_0615 [Flavobacteriaceae bacterium MAR_2010_188]|nr:hypothetical protein SAMN03097699_0615 [Flavobacteriaceae bacterium MAR_2010_188]
MKHIYAILLLAVVLFSCRDVPRTELEDGDEVEIMEDTTTVIKQQKMMDSTNLKVLDTTMTKVDSTGMGN